MTRLSVMKYARFIDTSYRNERSNLFICDSADVDAFANERVFPKTFDIAWRHWLSIRGDNALPNRRDLDLLSIAPAVPHFVLTEVLHGPPLDFKFKIIGTHVDERLREKITNTLLSEAERTRPGTNIWNAYETATRLRAPVLTALPYVGAVRKIEYTRELFMPTVDDENNVNYVLVVVDFFGDYGLLNEDTRWTA